jgi:uncharacterized protein YrrD
MLRSFKALRGFAIRATDGRIGSVSDVYFDDSNWRVRHCVVDSDRWFGGRYVLVRPRLLSILDSRRRELWVRLAKAEVRRSREAESDKPVSKQQASGVMTSIRRLGRRSWADHPDPTGPSPDHHLRSCSAVIGHRVEAVDGTIGSVADFLIDDKGWIVRELIVATSHRNMPATHVRLAAAHVGSISWPNSSVAVDLRRDELLGNPSYDPTANEVASPPLPI